ncbi:MAG TPA: SAM-dependent chlorinase/fluorinase [Candidatus Binatia bacterium]|nr:SAM-dependent chlorinase/fluorinase [Candidatus Binatia bacterium]
MIVTLTTDFGLDDPFVGIMKGVIASRAPEARIIDVTHAVPPQDVLAGALVLRHAVPYFPPRSVHVAVVDPGVGTARRPLCVEVDGGFLVGPDNGLLSLAAEATGVRRIVHLTEERFFLSPRSRTFHGRDVFAPVAAALVAGTPVSQLGAEIADMERLSVPAPTKDGGTIRGQVVYVDHFGNLVTNLCAEHVGAGATIRIGTTRLRGLAPSYAAVPAGEAVAVVDSWGLVEIAVRNGSARTTLGVSVGEPVLVET